MHKSNVTVLMHLNRFRQRSSIKIGCSLDTYITLLKWLFHLWNNRKIFLFRISQNSLQTCSFTESAKYLIGGSITGRLKPSLVVKQFNFNYYILIGLILLDSKLFTLVSYIFRKNHGLKSFIALCTALFKNMSYTLGSLFNFSRLFWFLLLTFFIVTTVPSMHVLNYDCNSFGK